MEDNNTNVNGINFAKYKDMFFILEKIKDTKFNGNHPNGYNTDFIIKCGRINLEVSNANCVLYVIDGPDRWFHTSEVQKQEEHDGYDLLYTLNSIYKVTPHTKPVGTVTVQPYQLKKKKNGKSK